MGKRRKKMAALFAAAVMTLECMAIPAAAADQTMEEQNQVTGGVIYQAPKNCRFDPARPSSRNSVLSPRAIQLKYQEDPFDNGIMLATWETSIVELLPERQGKFFPIYESLDYGQNWEEVGRVVETQRQDWEGEWEIENCPHIFELPADVGEMKKGGIVLFGDVCPRDLSQTHLDMYYSEDLGRTWEFVSSVVTDGGSNYMGRTPGPVWEPFVLYDPVMEALVCFYSDEREEKYGQKLVLQYTKDGKNWSEVIDVMAQEDVDMRPGMPVVTQMENGHYVMVYEGVGLNYMGQGLPCNYKVSKYPNDVIHWDAADIGYTYGYGGSPYCTTLPSGHIAMTCSDNEEVFINTQKDLSGEFIKYPTGVPVGYNRQLIPLDDGTEKGALYTLSCEFPDTGKANSVKWGKLDLNTVTIPDTKAVRYQITDDTKGVVDLWPKEGYAVAGADQYFSVEAKRGCVLDRIFVNGQEADLQKSWFKVPQVRGDIRVTATGMTAPEDAKLIRSKEETQYYLCPPGYSMEDGREIFEWTWENHPDFYWTIEPGEQSGTYRIKNQNSKMYLSVKDAESFPKANVIQTTAADERSLWQITEVEDGWFRIINASSGLAVTRGKVGDFGTPTERFAVQKPYTGSDDQLWGIEYVLEDTPVFEIRTEDISNGTIQVNLKKEAAGATVYVTAVPDEGYMLKANSLKVNGEVVRDGKFEMPEEDVEITAQFRKSGSSGSEELPYEDVKKTDWFYDGVCFNYENGYMLGKDETHFAPLENLVRAQFAIILHRMEGKPEVPYRSDFIDVADELWYTDAIMWAASEKIVTGYTDGSRKFGPADPILREQMAVMMYRYAERKGYPTTETESFEHFEDADKVTAYAEKAMQWAVGSGIITGKYNGTQIDPQGSALRAECAIIIERFQKKFS